MEDDDDPELEVKYRSKGVALLLDRARDFCSTYEPEAWVMGADVPARVSPAASGNVLGGDGTARLLSAPSQSFPNIEIYS